MKVYIAGPMTGYEEFNFPQFFQAERELIALGHTPLNPAWNNGLNLQEAVENANYDGRSWQDYMRKDLNFLSQADALCVLDGWKNSKGARLEVHIARQLDIPVMFLEDGKLVPRVQVLGLAGYARSGKDSVAQELNKQGYVSMSFAGPIKKAIAILDPKLENDKSYNEVVEELGLESAKDEYPEVRRLLQVFGTEVGRTMFGEDFWVDYALNSIPDGLKVVFTDVRYPNEANTIKDFGGEVWWISREGIGPLNDHASENSLIDYPFEFYIDNSGTLEELKDKVLAGLNNDSVLTIDA
jgi:hypothetical protein